MSLVYLTNGMPPYRVPVFQELAQLAAPVTFIFSEREARPYAIAALDGLTVRHNRSLRIPTHRRHVSGFVESETLQVPLDIIPLLLKLGPETVFCAEMGARTLQAVAYRKLRPRTRLVVHADLSERTELGTGRVRQLVRSFIFRNADAVIVNGSSGFRYVHSHGYPANKIFIIPYTTGIGPFLSVPIAREARNIRLLYVGQLIERKGLLPFCCELCRWARSHTSQETEFWIAGYGPLRDRLMALQFPANVHFRMLGLITYDRLPSLLAEVDALVLPTLADTWALVVNEAMAAGVPVLGSVHAQGVDELVEEGRTGWRFQAERPNDMYSALCRALSTSAEGLREMGRLARARVASLTAASVAHDIYSVIQATHGAESEGITSLRDRTPLLPPDTLPSTPKRRRVAIVQKSIPHYRKSFFEALRDELSARDIELNLIYGDPRSADQSKGDLVDIAWGTKIPQGVWSLWGRDIIWQPARRLLKDMDLVVVEQANKLLLNYLLLFQQRFGGTRIAFWGHGRCFQKTGAISANEWMKRWLCRWPHWWFAYNDLAAKVVEDAGYPAQRITRVQNAIDTRALVSARRAISDGRIMALRKELGIGSDKVGIYIGGMYREKRLPFLVSACDRIRELVPDFHAVFMGGGPDANLVISASRSRRFLHYVGPQFGEAKVAHAALGKCFLMPGLVGLAILDAFAMELPLVTMASDSHSPEIDYLQDGTNGLMVQSGEDVEAYAQAVARVLTDEPLHQQLVQGCRASQERYTIEEMARRYAEGIQNAIDAIVP